MKLNFNKSEYNHLARYLSGELSEQEKAEIEARITNDPMFARFIKRLSIIWNATNTSPDIHEIEAACQKINKEIDAIELSHPETVAKTFKTRPTRYKSLIRPYRSVNFWVYRIAAVLIIVGLTGLFSVLLIEDGTDEEQFALQEVVTKKGQRSNIQLKDGSRIVLNSGSRISYPREFSEKQRSVHIEGEVYFDIVNEDRPFYVFADDAIIKVLGTEFNVRSYEEDDIKVVVKDGSVSVNYSYADTPDEGAVLLEKGEMATLPRQKTNEPLSVRKLDNKDMARHLGWLDYRFIFDDTPLGEVARSLERSYDVNFIFQDPEMEKLRLSVSFESESIHDVLQVIQLVFNLEYKIDGREVFLYKTSTTN